MAAADPVIRIAPGERRPGAPTPGMVREEAFDTGSTWAGLVRTEAETVSGWHHHGAYETVVYVLTGHLRMDSGPGGAERVDAGPGDFLLVPRGAIHREGNPDATEGEVVVVRSGSGPPVTNVDGPARSRQ